MNKKIAPTLDRMPEPANIQELMRISGGFQATAILLSAHELSVFTRIGSASRTAGVLAKSIRCSVRGTTILLDALVALGLLRKRAGRYTNTPIGRKHLVEGAAEYKGALLSHMRYSAAGWLQLSDAIRSGTAPRIGRTNPILDDPKTNRDFILAMHDVGFDMAKTLTQKIDLSGSRSLLDLGGGPGSYSIALCRKYPKLHATLVDLPQTLKVARKHLKGFTEGKRIATKAADFFRAPGKDFGSGYDVALLSNILHAASPPKVRALLKKVYTALEPNGIVLVNEFLLSDNRTAPVSGALFAVNMLAATTDGNSYTQKELGQWLRTAGFKAPKTIDLDGIHVVTQARKK